MENVHVYYLFSDVPKNSKNSNAQEGFKIKRVVRLRKYNSGKLFVKKPLNLDSKSPRAARQPRFLQIFHHNSNGTMKYESIFYK